MSDLIGYDPVGTACMDKLVSFFELVENRGDSRYFHPHPFDKKTAENVSRYMGLDLYFVQTMDKKICGYGMLRGWDEGYTVPSLGIIIHPDYRSRKLGEKFMEFLHEQARKKGADRILLKVYPENLSAIALYQKMGYVFSGRRDGQLLGYAQLKKT
ncbi:GNAT family N-acetyltransferase [Desulfobacter postgatei]|uniref:GNAT family N-acetyltransferase n=1 Tax=Desulfobacter postgatei TaxID=2293 RepID=UPI00259BD938|nr:GNAT family N-acetyltransferase [uncultured Desulfobacter sp.]